MLTPDKLDLYKQRAEAGDSRAAFALYEHYEELGEAQEANKWLHASLSDNDVRLGDMPDGVPVNDNDRFRLQPNEFNAKLAAVASGDMPSAEVLYLHYSFGEYDEVLSEKWRLTAASLGSEHAQCAMAVALMDAAAPDLSQARTWAAAAEAAGSQRGSELVRMIDERLKNTQ